MSYRAMLGLRIGSRIHDDDMRDICAYAVVCGLRELTAFLKKFDKQKLRKRKNMCRNLLLNIVVSCFLKEFLF